MAAQEAGGPTSRRQGPAVERIAKVIKSRAKRGRKLASDKLKPDTKLRRIPFAIRLSSWSDWDVAQASALPCRQRFHTRHGILHARGPIRDKPLALLLRTARISDSKGWEPVSALLHCLSRQPASLYATAPDQLPKGSRRRWRARELQDASCRLTRKLLS